MEITIYDHQIFAVNRSKAKNEADSLIYKAKDGLHQIDFDECAKNFKAKCPTASNWCIGERNMEKGYFLLFTNGLQTKIVFRKSFVFPIQNALLNGTKQERFLKLQKLLAQTKYTTYDLT